MLPLRQFLRIRPQPVRIFHAGIHINIRASIQRERRSSSIPECRVGEEEHCMGGAPLRCGYCGAVPKGECGVGGVVEDANIELLS